MIPRKRYDWSPPLLGAILLLVAHSAEAAVITHTVTTPGFPAVTTGVSTLPIPQFNPALGELTQIRFTLTGVTSTTVVGSNPTAHQGNKYTDGDQVAQTVGDLTQFTQFQAEAPLK